MNNQTLVLPICESVQVHLLVENTARGAGILGEHGLSWWIQSEGRSLLFDLGQGYTLESNAGQVGIDWAASEAVVFSHGHYDHVAPNHCTGDRALARIYAAFPLQTRELHAGQSLNFPLPLPA